MKLFLASSLSFVSDVVVEHIGLSGKKVGCIRDAANEWGGKSAWWNQLDIDFFKKNGAHITDIDMQTNTLEDIDQQLSNIDILFVGGGDEAHLAQLFEQKKCKKTIVDCVKNGVIYMGTSAGSMIAADQIHSETPGKNISGLGLTNINIIPHWHQPSHKKYRLEMMDSIYSFGGNSIMLNDISIVVVSGDHFSLEQSKKHSLKDTIKEFNKHQNFD